MIILLVLKWGIFKWQNQKAGYAKIDKNKCTNCSVCTRKCKMNIEVCKSPNSSECIRCGECIKACPTKAIKKGIKL